MADGNFEVMRDIMDVLSLLVAVNIERGEPMFGKTAKLTPEHLATARRYAEMDRGYARESLDEGNLPAPYLAWTSRRLRIAENVLHFTERNMMMATSQ